MRNFVRDQIVFLSIVILFLNVGTFKVHFKCIIIIPKFQLSLNVHEKEKELRFLKYFDGPRPFMQISDTASMRLSNERVRDKS